MPNPISSVIRLGLYLSMAAIVAVMLIVTVDVVLRNLFASSIPGSVEVSQFLQGIAVFLGIAATLRAGSHISADFLVERLSPRAQAGFDLFTGLISLAVFSLMTYALWAMATGPGSSREISELLGLPTRPFKLLAAFGVGLMCLEILRQVFVCATLLLGSTKPTDTGEAP